MRVLHQNVVQPICQQSVKHALKYASLSYTSVSRKPPIHGNTTTYATIQRGYRFLNCSPKPILHEHLSINYISNVSKAFLKSTNTTAPSSLLFVQNGFFNQTNILSTKTTLNITCWFIVNLSRTLCILNDKAIVHILWS